MQKKRSLGDLHQVTPLAGQMNLNANAATRTLSTRQQQNKGGPSQTQNNFVGGVPVNSQNKKLKGGKIGGIGEP